jgi:hypothetical protein
MLEPATDTKPAPARPELRVFRPDNPYVALGLAVSHLMTKPTFAALRFGEWSRIRYHPSSHKNLCRRC